MANTSTHNPHDRKLSDRERSIALREPVTALPSGDYGVYAPTHRAGYETEPVLQVAQRIDDCWFPTPARYYARSLTGATSMSIDHGQGWALTAEDAAAVARFARCTVGASAVIVTREQLESLARAMYAELTR